MPGAQFNPMPNNRPGELERRVRDLERLVQEQAGARTLENATIGAGGLTIEGGQLVIKDMSGTVLATLDSTGLHVTGIETVSGTLNVTGNTVIGGTLSLPNGIINNDALANPVTAVSAHASGDSFALATGANVAKATATVTVPTGFTKALVQAFAAVSAWNPTASADVLYLGCRINNPAGVDQNTGWSMSHTVPASSQGAVAESSTALMTGLTAGQTFTVQATASSGTAVWSASGSNVANIDATIIWLR